MKTLAEKIAVMQAAERGESIETLCYAGDSMWIPSDKPTFNWVNFDYRVKPRALEIVVWHWEDSTVHVVETATQFNALLEQRKAQRNVIVDSRQTITY